MKQQIGIIAITALAAFAIWTAGNTVAKCVSTVVTDPNMVECMKAYSRNQIAQASYYGAGVQTNLANAEKATPESKYLKFATEGNPATK